MAKDREYHLTKDNAQALMDAVIEEVYTHSVTKFRVELTAAIDELPIVHVEFDAHAHDYAVTDYLQKMGYDEVEDDKNKS